MVGSGETDFESDADKQGVSYNSSTESRSHGKNVVDHQNRDAESLVYNKENATLLQKSVNEIV